MQLTIYRYPEYARTAMLRITLPETDQQLKIRISIRAEQSNTAVETLSYTVEPENARVIETQLEIPDNRGYTYTVYNGDTQLEQKSLIARVGAEEETAENE